jgi:predicted N-acetyltransferase YhbS
VPGVLLARLAVDRRFEGQGIGSLLFMDAAVNTMQAVDYVGGHVLVVDAKDARAAAWYGRFGVQALPSQPLRLFLTVKELKRLHLMLEAEACQS